MRETHTCTSVSILDKITTEQTLLSNIRSHFSTNKRHDLATATSIVYCDHRHRHQYDTCTPDTPLHPIGAARRRQVLTSFQMTVSDSPVVLEVPTEKINLRSHATSSSLSTWTST